MTQFAYEVCFVWILLYELILHFYEVNIFAYREIKYKFLCTDVYICDDFRPRDVLELNETENVLL